MPLTSRDAQLSVPPARRPQGGSGREGTRLVGSENSRYENGAGNFPIDEVAKLLEYYDVPEARRGRLLALAEDAEQRGWWGEYADVLTSEYLEFIELEAEAESVINWVITGIPGLLQTEAYARAVFRQQSSDDARGARPDRTPGAHSHDPPGRPDDARSPA